MPYLTPQATPDSTICRVLLIPDELYWLAAVQGALDELTKVYNWEQVTGITPQEAAEAAQKIVFQTYESVCMPVGAVIPYAGGLPPDGYLTCDGQRYAKSEYPALAEVIAFNLWDPTDYDYFFVPDLNDKFVMGGITGNDVGKTGGSASVALTENQLPVVTVIQDAHNHIQNPHEHTQQGHQHVYNVPSFNLDVEGPGAPDPLGFGQPMLPAGTDWRAPVINQNTATNQSTVATNQPFGGGEAHENRPPYVQLRYIIKCR